MVLRFISNNSYSSDSLNKNNKDNTNLFDIFYLFGIRWFRKIIKEIEIKVIYISSSSLIYWKRLKIIKLNYLKFLIELHLILIYLMK